LSATVFCFNFPRVVSPPGGKLQPPRSSSCSIWSVDRNPEALMRVARLFVAFVLIIASSPRLNSQQSTTAPERDSDAVVVVTQALAAMGGSTLLTQVQNSLTQGTIQATDGSWLTSGDFTWEFSGSQFRYDNPDSAGRSILVSGKHGPVSTVGGKTSRLFSHMTDASFSPHLPGLVLLQRMLNPIYSFEFVGKETLAGQAVIHIRTTRPEDKYWATISTQDWFFDAASFLPLRIEHRLPASGNALLTMPASVAFSDFRSVSGILVPFQLSFSVSGQTGGTAKLSSVSFNVAIDPADFDTPAGVVL